MSPHPWAPEEGNNCCSLLVLSNYIQCFTHRHNTLMSGKHISALFCTLLRVQEQLLHAVYTCVCIYIYRQVDMCERLFNKKRITVATGNYEQMHACTHFQIHPDPLKPFNFWKEILIERGNVPVPVHTPTKSSAARKGVSAHPGTSHEPQSKRTCHKMTWAYE